MKRSIYVRLFCCFVLIGLLLLMPTNRAYAQTRYAVEVGERTAYINLTPYSDGTQIMVPFKSLTEALGGIYLDIPIGTAYKVAILNNWCFCIITGIDIQVSFSVTGEVLDSFTKTGSTEDLFYDIQDMIANDVIHAQEINFPIIEKDGDIFLPLEVFSSAFYLDVSESENVIRFSPNFVSYRSAASNVTFELEIPSKTYDGEPLTWSESELRVFCNGVQVTDYLPLSCEYVYTDTQTNLQNVETLPVNAGTYALKIKTNPDDPKYSGVGYFSFAIYPAELILTAQDKTVSKGRPLPPFSYDILGIVSGENEEDALAAEPVLSLNDTPDISQSGAYAIEVTGGTAGKNYLIKDRRSGTLTVLGAQRVSIQIQCVDEATSQVIKTDRKQAEIGASILIQAPSFPGYYVSGQAEQKVTASDDALVTFYYAIAADDTEPVLKKTYPPYITGYMDGTFRPQNNIKRSECVVMLHRLLTQDEQTTNIRQFTDVPSNAWYSDAVGVLAAKGIINGYSDGTFRPETDVTRSEFVAMALRLAETPLESTESRFLDVTHEYWAMAYIQTAAHHGIVSGYLDGTFCPEKPITRAEAVSILNKISGRSACVVTGNPTSFSDVPNSYWAYETIQLAANQSSAN